jgi:hypothetical protein
MRSGWCVCCFILVFLLPSLDVRVLLDLTPSSPLFVLVSFFGERRVFPACALSTTDVVKCRVVRNKA